MQKVLDMYFEWQTFPNCFYFGAALQFNTQVFPTSVVAGQSKLVQTVTVFLSL